MNGPLGGPQQRAEAAARLNAVLAQIEGESFADYALFTGSMREYTVRSLEQTFKAETAPTDTLRRMYMLAIYREQFMTYGRPRRVYGRIPVERDAISPMTRIMNCKPGEARLSEVFGRFDVKTGNALFDKLALSSWVPGGWNQEFPTVDLPKVMRRACAFFVVDCTRH